MPIKFRDDFANLANWNVTQIAGAVVASGNKAVFTPGNAGLDKTGIILASPIVMDIGDQISWRAELDSSAGTNDVLIGGLGQTSSLNSSNGVDFYVDGGSPTVYAWDHPGTTNIGSVTIGSGGDILKFVCGTGVGNEFVDMYIGASNVFTSVNFGSGADEVGSPQYFKINVDSINNASGTLYISEFFWTDSAGFDPPAPSSLSAGTPLSTSIPFTWSDGSIDAVNADGIELFADDGGGEFSAGTYAVGDEAGDATGLTPNTSYDIVARAYVVVRGVTYYSSDSNTVNITTDSTGSNANAGTDQIITWPTNTATMAATATNATSILWTKVSGPGTVSFDDDSIEDPIATVSLPGTYVLNMHTDDGLGGTDDDTVTLEFNQAPVVDAGPDQVVDDPEDTVTLAGSVSDDGLPATPGSVDILWTQISGPGTAVFVDDTDPETDVSFDATGEYVLQLAADDGDTSSTDTVKITINIPPTCNAGTDQDVLKSAGADLDGTASDTDGLPDPPAALTTTWSKHSGPGVVTFTPNANALDAHADFSLGGVYVLRLSAYDGATTVTDDVTINVDAPPVVDAGPDQKIRDPNATIQLAGSVTDEGFPDPPAAVTALWEQVSGPGTVVFADDTDPATTCTVDQAGIYTLRLTGDDSNQTAEDTVELRIGLQDGIPVAFKARAVGRI